ncbi:hypothetical protein [Lysinibacillus sphaericus]|uniref:hypothetical protein n=1 Tax=Lysinibacillus sphaericus TaxID=1421 RepID=UPI003D715265
MNYDKIIELLERYSSVSKILGIKEDTQTFNELIEFLKSGDLEKNDSHIKSQTRKSKYGEEDFYNFINDNDYLDCLELNNEIKINKHNMISYWASLNNKQQEQFTIFELNIILFLISEHYNKYQKKDKKKIISLVSNVVKEKRMSTSYYNIHV